MFGFLLLPFLYIKRRIERNPQFGAAGKAKAVRQSPNWRNGRFRNLDKTPIQEDLASLFGDLIGYWKAKNTYPSAALPVFEGPQATELKKDKDYLTWYGHSALRLETGGKTILLDPMLGDWVAPIPFLGHRFDYSQPLDLNGFEEIDLIVYSHDHYDHLDYESLLALKDKTKAFLVPLGVGSHLRKWGVPAEKISEVDWWDEVEIGGIRFIATPARHFGGRKPRLRNKTLWCGFAIYTAHSRIYFGGDSGYGQHFCQIGERLGPFDICMLDSAQYHKRWKNVHMVPEETIQAVDDLGAEQLLPIHWGGFTLSDHPWSEPVRRILAADLRKCTLLPQIRERIQIGDREYHNRNWWD